MRNVEKLIVVLLILVGVAIAACTQNDPKPAQEMKQAGDGKLVSTTSGLAYTDLAVGSGASPVAGKPVKVHHTG